MNLNSGGITCLLSFGKRKKKIYLSEPTFADFNSKLLDQIYDAFRGPNLIYMVNDEQFNQETEIDKETEFFDLMVIEVRKVFEEDEEGSQRKIAIDSEILAIEESSANNKGSCVSMEGNECGIDSLEEDQSNKEKSSNSWVIQDEETLIPNKCKTNFYLDYKVPTLPDEATNPSKYKSLCEMQKEFINKEVLTLIYNDLIHKYSLYPLSWVAVSKKLIREYPHLSQTPGAGYEFWRNKLRSKFKNFRFKIKDDNNVNEAKAKFGLASRKSVTHESSGSDSVEINEAVRFEIPEQEVFEDVISIAAHKKNMCEELKKKDPDWAVIRSKMVSTLADRTTIIREEKLSVVLQAYPALTNAKQLDLEFFNIKNIYLNENILSALILNSDAIWKIVTAKTTLGLKSEILEKMRRENCDEEKNKLRATGTLLLIPSLFRERYQRMFMAQKDLNNIDVEPVIVYNKGSILFSDEFSIYLDKVKLCEVFDIVTAFSIYFSLFWIFNVVYAKCLCKSLLFVENYLLGINYTKISTKVENVINMCRNSTKF